MLEFVSEFYNKLINKRITFKCTAYVNKKGDDTILDAFEIQEYSLRRAYKTAYDVLKLKYPDTGLDLRIYNK